MAMPTPQEVTAKWLARLSSATTEMTQGVQRVSEAPGASAAKKKQKWINSLASPAVHEKWARNVASVSLSAWQESMTGYGIARVSQGAAAKQGKFEHILTQLLPFIEQVQSKVKTMPDNTYEEREQRMLAMSRGMRQFKRTG